jgi:hypothetical protein
LKPVLPEAERIYYKDFHFLDEPLIDRQNCKESDPNKPREKTHASESSNNNPAPGSSAVSTADGSMMMLTKGSLGCA